MWNFESCETMNIAEARSVHLFDARATSVARRQMLDTTPFPPMSKFEMAIRDCGESV
jgi:hypothetical protein